MCSGFFSPWVLKTFLFLLACAMLFMSSCDTDPNGDVANIDLDIDFVRVDSLMYAAAREIHKQPDENYLKLYQGHLQVESPFFWQQIGARGEYKPTDNISYQDSLIALNLGELLKDSLMYSLLDTIQQVYPSSQQIKAKILPPLKRLKREFPDIEFPAFRTHANGFASYADVNTIDQVSSFPGYISLGLHYFLGDNYRYYPGNLPQYIKARMKPEYMEVMLISEIAEEFVRPLDSRKAPRLIDDVVRTGIKLYFIEQLLPSTPDSLILYYSQDQLAWANAYEKYIFKDMTEGQKLYSSDFNMMRDYLSEKPYTTHMSLESPPRLGWYFGLNVLRAFMDRHSEISLAELTEMDDYDYIFRESRYKP